MPISKTLAALALVTAALLAPCGAEAKAPPKTKIITEACTKNLRTGDYSYDVSKFSSDYVIGPISFRETSRDGRVAHGVCTIHLRYQPPD